MKIKRTFPKWNELTDQEAKLYIDRAYYIIEKKYVNMKLTYENAINLAKKIYTNEIKENNSKDK